MGGRIGAVKDQAYTYIGLRSALATLKAVDRTKRELNADAGTRTDSPRGVGADGRDGLSAALRGRAVLDGSPVGLAARAVEVGLRRPSRRRDSAVCVACIGGASRARRVVVDGAGAGQLDHRRDNLGLPLRLDEQPADPVNLGRILARVLSVGSGVARGARSSASAQPVRNGVARRRDRGTRRRRGVCRGDLRHCSAQHPRQLPRRRHRLGISGGRFGSALDRSAREHRVRTQAVQAELDGHGQRAACLLRHGLGLSGADGQQQLPPVRPTRHRLATRDRTDRLRGLDAFPQEPRTGGGSARGGGSRGLRDARLGRADR